VNDNTDNTDDAPRETMIKAELLALADCIREAGAKGDLTAMRRALTASMRTLDAYIPILRRRERK